MFYTKPKFQRPVKSGNDWPGLVRVNFKHPGVQYPFKFMCPQPLCFISLVAATEEKIIEQIETHTCPWFGGGTTTFSWGVMSDDYLTPIWKMLDEQVDIIKGGGSAGRTDDQVRLDMQDARMKARGIAESLAILMPPFFTTGDEIVREAVVRWERRQAGADYETPGLGRFKFQRPPGVVGDPDNPSWVTQPEYDTKAPKPAPKHNLTDAEVASVKASKNFPVAMLAAAYNTTEAVIKYLQSE